MNWLARTSLVALCTMLALPSGIVEGQRRVDAREPQAVERQRQRRLDAERALQRAASAGSVLSGARRGALLKLQPGDLVSAVGSDAQALRIVLRPRSVRVKKEALAEQFVTRGVAHDTLTGRVAIAAVSRVLLYDPESGLLEEIVENGAGDPFGFVNDVLFDEDGMLLIADQGGSPSGKEPTDGRIWEYDPESGEMVRLAGRRALSNPAFLAEDSRGRILVVDLEAGALVSGLLEARWDRVYLLKGARRKGARPVFKGDGLQATAFDVGPDDRMWFGSFSELQVIDGKRLSTPCPILELPFDYVTGLVVLEENLALVSDGADTVTARRFIHQVDDACATEIRAKGKRLNGVRGLALVEAPAESDS